MVIYSKEFRLICNSWLTFLGYSNKVTRNLKGVSDDMAVAVADGTTGGGLEGCK